MSPENAAKLVVSTDYWTILAISSCWLDRCHPDPDGHHLQLLVAYLKAFADLKETVNHVGDWGLFWDFCSLPQKGPNGTRTQTETDLFVAGFSKLNILYGWDGTVKIQMKGGMPKEIRPYTERGWCVFEEAVSCLSTPSWKMLDLGSARDAILKEGKTEYYSFLPCCTTPKPTPIHPDDMDAKLDDVFFTDGADRAPVKLLYSDLFWGNCKAAKELTFINNVGPVKGNPWGPSDFKQLSKVLPCFQSCKRLYLCGHRPLDDGITAVTAGLELMPNLEELWLGGKWNQASWGQPPLIFGTEGLAAFCRILPRMEKLHSLSVPFDLKHTSEGELLILTWTDLGKPIAQKGELIAPGLYWWDSKTNTCK